MRFMVFPIEQGVHSPQIMTSCPKGLENRYWVRTYSYNDISRLLLSSCRLHATARPQEKTSVVFVYNLWHLKSPMGSNRIGIFLDRKKQNNRKWVTQKVGFLSFMMSCLHDYFFLRAFVWVKAEGGDCKEQPKKVKAPYLFPLLPYWTKASWMMHSREKKTTQFLWRGHFLLSFPIDAHFTL